MSPKLSVRLSPDLLAQLKARQADWCRGNIAEPDIVRVALEWGLDALYPEADPMTAPASLFQRELGLMVAQERRIKAVILAERERMRAVDGRHPDAEEPAAE